MNMKNILRLMGALALTTGAATSVVACNQASGATMNADVSKQLGLTDDKGQGLQEATLDTSKIDSMMWTVPALVTPIAADKLLTAENKAANQSCFDFITNVLKVKPTTGTKLDDGVFDKTALTAITGEVTKIIPTLKKMDNSEDYAIDGGTFSFQFKKGDEKIGDVYGIKLKSDNTKGVINNALDIVVKTIKIADTDVASNKDIMFKVGVPVPATAKPGVAVKVLAGTKVGKQFNALNKLTALKITAQLKKINHANTDWNVSDTLEIGYKTGDVTFTANTLLSL